MPCDYFQIEDEIQEIISSLDPYKKHNITRLARDHQVPRKRLQARINGRATRSERTPTHQRMTNTQILALELYVTRLNAIGQPPLIPQLRAAAESIRRLTTPEPERGLLTDLGRDFFTGFVQVHPQFSHFQSLQEVIEKLTVCKEDVWNIDECVFRIGIGGDQDVITMETYKAAESPSETKRGFITMVEAISAGGGTIPPP
jgi:hypothetical protein